jgi:hypothetical protein
MTADSTRGCNRTWSWQSDHGDFFKNGTVGNVHWCVNRYCQNLIDIHAPCRCCHPQAPGDCPKYTLDCTGKCSRARGPQCQGA